MVASIWDSLLSDLPSCNVGVRMRRSIRGPIPLAGIAYSGRRSVPASPNTSSPLYRASAAHRAA